MKTVKRLEIIIDDPHVPHVIAALEKAGVTGYSMMRNVTGHGERGFRYGDEVTNAFQNCYILAACPPDVAHRAIEDLRSLLHQHGGVCLISDAQWLMH